MSVMDIFWMCFFIYIFIGVIVGLFSRLIIDDVKFFKNFTGVEKTVIAIWFGVFWFFLLMWGIFLVIKLFIKGFPLSIQVFNKYRSIRQKELLNRKQKELDDLMSEIENLKTLGD